MMEISEKKLFFRLWKLFSFGAKFSPALKPEIFFWTHISSKSSFFNSYGVQTPSCKFGTLLMNTGHLKSQMSTTSVYIKDKHTKCMIIMILNLIGESPMEILQLILALWQVETASCVTDSDCGDFSHLLLSSQNYTRATPELHYKSLQWLHPLATCYKALICLL